MTLTQNSRMRLLTLCALYVAQGIPWGFVMVTLLAYLTDQGLDAGSLGEVAAVATLPWAFKFIWGPIIDRFGFRPMGRRRPWILVAQAMMALTLLAMVFFKELTSSVETLLVLVFIHNVFASLQDVAVDALAVDLLEEDERGRANGFMWASKYFGMLLGGAGMGAALSLVGIRGALLVQVSLLFGIMMLPLFLRERTGDRFLPWTRGVREDAEEAEESPGTLEILRKLKSAMSSTPARVGMAYALVANSATALGGTFTNMLLSSQEGWDPGTVSEVLGGYSIFASVGAAVVAGFLVDRLGVRRIITVGTLLVGANYIVFGLGGAALWGNMGLVIATMLIVSGLNSAVQVAQFALFMGLCSPLVAATQFTAYMALLNVSMTWAQTFNGFLHETFGYTWGLVVLGCFHAATVVFLWWIRPVPREAAEDGGEVPVTRAIDV